MEQWAINLVYENASVQTDIMKLNYYLKSNSESVVNKGDDMYGVMQDQLKAMVAYQRCLIQRINLVQKRSQV